jgi:hypothetical protein
LKSVLNSYFYASIFHTIKTKSFERHKKNIRLQQLRRHIAKMGR